MYCMSSEWLQSPCKSFAGRKVQQSKGFLIKEITCAKQHGEQDGFITKLHSANVDELKVKLVPA